MGDSQFLFCNLLVSCFFAGSLCTVLSFSPKDGSESLSGASVSLICTLDKYTGFISIFKSTDKINVGDALSRCNDATCRNLNDNYNFTITGATIVEITIKSLQRTEDQKWWTCRTSENSKRSEQQFFLTVYTVPSRITLKGPTRTCNLGQSDCKYTCTTDQCTYPSPTFTWLFVLNDSTTEVRPYNTLVSEKSNSCADETMIYENALTFTRYQLSTDNTPKTVRLQCRITFTALSSGTRTSALSQNVVFAVKVSTVQISDGNNQLTGKTFTVVNKEEKFLNCIPGNGNPTPTVEWFIGNSRASTEAQFRFIPDNSHHGQQIYCVADNIPNNGQDDAVSHKPVLYVKVEIQFVYIEPAADNVISVIEKTAEPAVCTTSAARPGSMIKWYKKYENNIELGEGVSTDFESTDSNLIVTKSTKTIKVLRSDSGWTLSCTASNFEGSSPIWANNSKQLNVLYPPEHMSILLDGEPVIGPVVDVIRGTPGTLKCTAVSNPISVFSWNNKQMLGDTLTIDDNIQNGQIVNCTASNNMISTNGIVKDGDGSIAKTINLRYGPLIERIEINGDKGSTWEFKANESISIACYVDSNPNSTISLFQGIKPLKKKKESAVLVYTISSVQCSHTGEYTCNAENGINNVQQPAAETVQINIKCSPRLDVGTQQHSVFAKENTSAVLSLTILAYPIPTNYTWKRNTSNGWEILNNSSFIRMTEESLQFNLTFISVKLEDYGEYELTVYYTNNVPFSFTGFLKADGEPEPHTYQPDDGSTAGIIGAVVGGLIVVCLIVIVICILRRRKSFDDIKTKLFGKTSTTLGGEIKPQDTGYSYAAVEKPTGGSALNIIDNADAESSGGRNRAKKTKEITNEGLCYENPAEIIESDAKAKPPKKGKSAKQKDKKQISQSHDGLQYVELSFSDTKKKGKKTKAVQPKADERTVYDAVQFGVVGAAYTSNGEENTPKSEME